ncbi:MAG: DUF2326 domain-containing protein [Candidatus Paceibacterota bacterium]|jgi:uncharacterized protein YydD (DUF2326 family)
MIKRVFSNKQSFREVTFEKGFNVVLADKALGSTKKDSRNGVGKSFLIEIIHFCLGADANPGKGLLISKLDEFTFSLELVLDDKNIIVHRSVLEYGSVDIEGDFSSWPLQPQYSGTTKTNRLSIEDWKSILGYFKFKLPIEGGKYSPTFRSLFSYSARKGMGAFNNPFKYFPQQREWGVQINNNYLLGINWEYAKDFQVIKDRENTLDELRKAARQGLLEDAVGTMGELHAERVRLAEELLTLESQLKDFKVHPQYKEVQKEADEFTQKIHALLNKINTNERILREYQKTIQIEEDVSIKKVQDLYTKAGVVFSDTLVRSLENVENFHETIVVNRKEYLQNEIKRLEQAIVKDRKTVEEFSEERSATMRLLQSHGALEEYDSLQGKKTGIKEKLERVKSAIKNLSSFEEGKSALKIEHEELTQKARMDMVERSEFSEKAISLFNKNSNSLYSKPGRLTIDIQKSGYKFNVEIERSGSQGVDYMKVFCYDLTLSQLWSGIVKNYLLIHDSTIFDGVDERQVAKSLELAATESERLGFQYICTINSDDIPSGEFSTDFAKKFNDAIRITLTDKDENQSLLGFRF